MTKDIKEYVTSCMICQRMKRRLGKLPGDLQTILAERPFEILGMDVLSKLPETYRGYKHILVIVDYFTKWIEAFPMRDETAETIARILLRKIILRHGAPEKVISDKGSAFIFEVFNLINDLMWTKHKTTTAYHPQTDGQAENAVKTVSQLLQKLVETK